MGVTVHSIGQPGHLKLRLCVIYIALISIAKLKRMIEIIQSTYIGQESDKATVYFLKKLNGMTSILESQGLTNKVHRSLSLSTCAGESLKGQESL